MKKIRDWLDRLTSRIGKKLFPGADEKTRKRWVVWLLIFLLGLAVMGAYRYRVMHELRQYQRIMETYSILFQ